MNKDAELLLYSGRTLIASYRCQCQACLRIINGVNEEFAVVAARFAVLANKKPGLVFKILVEEWDRTRILNELPELYE